MDRKKRKTEILNFIIPDYSLEALIDYYNASKIKEEEKLVAWEEFKILISCSTIEECKKALSNFIVLRWSVKLLRQLKSQYAPIFDQRILTEKLLGKPSPGLPPPYMLAFV